MDRRAIFGLATILCLPQGVTRAAPRLWTPCVTPEARQQILDEYSATPNGRAKLLGAIVQGLDREFAEPAPNPDYLTYVRENLWVVRERSGTDEHYDPIVLVSYLEKCDRALT